MSIEIHRLFKSFREKKVLRGVSLSIKKGETFVILGPSGCGKSVLLKNLIGLIQPDSGRVFINDIDIAKLSEIELFPIRKQVAMLFQNGALFDSYNVKENVAFPLRQHESFNEKEINHIVKEKLALVGLQDVEHLYPSELSGGMKKRVALARAIALNPSTILYDEPTTGLDPVMVSVIDELNLKLKHELGATSIVVTHDLVSAFRIADRMAVLYNGQVQQIGTPEDIKNSEDPVVQQFINGKLTGPIETHTG